MEKNRLDGWQVRRLALGLALILGIGGLFLTFAVKTLLSDRALSETDWSENLKTSANLARELEATYPNSTTVYTGIYIENLKEINIKSSFYRMDCLIWFRWTGDENLDLANNFRIFKGTINKKELVKSTHNDGVSYQLLRVDVSISKNFHTSRFPLESHILHCYIESNYLADRVLLLVDPTPGSGINPQMSITGFELGGMIAENNTYVYSNAHGDPAYSGPAVSSEVMSSLLIKRDGFGLYVKCFVALTGTLSWVLIALYINTNHKIDPLGMIPAALFGTVANILVGANLLPDALSLGLLEFVNFWGILMILSVVFSIINVNRIRNKHENLVFASFYGRIMFGCVLFLTLLGNILLPALAYIR